MRYVDYQNKCHSWPTYSNNSLVRLDTGMILIDHWMVINACYICIIWLFWTPLSCSFWIKWLHALWLLSSPHGFLVRSVLLISVVLCVVLLCVFTFLVPWCDVRYDFHIKTMFCSSLPPVVCGRDHVLFTLFVLCFFVLIVYILCLVYPMFPDSLDCQFFECPFGVL